MTTWAMPVGSGDAWAADYERGRPGWPPAVAGVAGLPPAAAVLDLGAGTGKLTRVLTAAFARVVAVEPADAMRRILTAVCPAAEALAGTAQRIPLEDDSMDGVFAGEAFHWFDDATALGEIARVLQPGGPLVLVWNVPAGPWEPSTADVEALLLARGPKPGEVRYDPLDLEGPHFATGEWRAGFADAPFGPLNELRLPNPQTLDREGLVAYYASMGWLADLPDEERLPLLEQARALLAADRYRRRWETQVFWTHLRGTRAPRHRASGPAAAR